VDVSRDSLKLSFGQVAWALSHGRPPAARTLDRLRYLRQLEVPFTEEERQGSGNRMVYRFEHLVECGLAYEGLRRRIKPQDIAMAIGSERKRLRARAKAIFDELDPAEFHRVNDAWRKPLYDPMQERFVRFHDRESQHPWTIEEVTIAKDSERKRRTIFDVVREDSVGDLIPFKNCIVSWVGWALVAPETRPGRP
jgi:hypothetical protein